MFFHQKSVQLEATSQLPWVSTAVHRVCKVFALIAVYVYTLKTSWLLLPVFTLHNQVASHDFWLFIKDRIFTVMDPVSIVTVLGTTSYLVGKHSTKQGYKNIFGNGHMQERGITKCVSTVFNDTFLKLHFFTYSLFNDTVSISYHTVSRDGRLDNNELKRAWKEIFVA